MIKNKMRSVHPGEVLREEYLVQFAVSTNARSIKLRVPAPRISDLVHESWRPAAARIQPMQVAT